MPSVEMPKEFTKTKKQKNFTFTKKKSLSGQSIQDQYIKISCISID